MEKHIPYEKLSKKRKREIDVQSRGSWGGINPVTRKPMNSKAYDRNKAKHWRKDSGDSPCLCYTQLTRMRHNGGKRQI